MTYLNEKIGQATISDQIFMIRATLCDDIYMLHYRNQRTGNTEPYKACLIPDYKTSVFMNGLFRDIKENKNLDRLEESDEEEEFENISPDKYVDLAKECRIICTYVRRFKLWKPLRYLEGGQICDKSEIMRLEKNNRH